ncbi:MAG: Cdc6/Cdc18 family protein [Promethearchaeota archaeon]
MEHHEKINQERREMDYGEKDFIDHLIDDFMVSKDVIFKDRSVLSPGFMPQIPSHREVQIKQLFNYFKPCFTNATPSNLLIYGKTGTGKTLVTRYMARRIRKRGRMDGILLPFIVYVNVQFTNTKFRILVKICEDLGLDFPHMGLSTDHVYNLLKNELKRRGQNLIVIIDEIDLLVKSKDKDDLLYILTRLSEDEPSIRISLIGISNDLRFRSFLGIRVLSSLDSQEIVFPPYQSLDLETILRERANLAFHEGVIDGNIIKAIAAIAAREHGDARKAIALLLKIGEVAEEEKSGYIDAHHVLKAQDKLEFDTMNNFIFTLPEQYKIVLIAISNIHHYCKCNVNTGSLLRIYHEMVRVTDNFVSKIGERRLLQILKDLQGHGLLDLSVVSHGRYGRHSMAKLSIDRKTIEKIFSKDPDLKKLLNFIPKIKSLDSFFNK